MKRDKVLFVTISEIFTNLSAGWFGAAFIVPTFSDKSLYFSLPILLGDLISGIVCFIIAYMLKKGDKRWIW